MKVYKDQGSDFIRCHFIKANYEYIHILQQNETIADGILRDRSASGNTAIGSLYLRRSWGEEQRFYQLNRFNTSGEILYFDQFAGKDDSDLRTLAKHSFNQETLEWTQLKVE